MKRDVERFIELLPDWEELSEDLDAIVLAPGDEDRQGWHYPGVVAVCAWERDLSIRLGAGFVKEHEEILNRLDVPIDERRHGAHLVRFTEGMVRAFQLMHVLLHELGHHHDRITTRSRRIASRGEGYAERYANRYADSLWEAYADEFGW